MGQMKKMSLLTFVGVTMALCANVRNIPILAASGWQLVSYLLFAIIFLALPMAAMAGELSSMYPGEGGLQQWVRNGLGEKWGFMTAWIVWAQMFPGMVMCAGTLGPALGNVFGNNALGNNHMFIFGCIIVAYWVLSLLNLKFDMATYGGQVGVWLGVYIPCVLLFVLGLATTLKLGITDYGYLGAFSWAKLIPDISNLDSLHYLTGIVFIFIGIEISSVYVPRMEHPQKYVVGVFMATLGLILLNLLNGALVANIVPQGTLELANITQPIRLECQYLGLPEITVNIFSIMVFVGILLQVSAWIGGPGKAITQCAREGLFPKWLGYHKVDKNGVSRNIIFTQLIVVSIFACLYAVLDDVNSVFLVMTNSTALIYCFAYLLIVFSFLRLRYKQPKLERAYRVGSSGNGMAWLVAIFELFAVFMCIATTLITSTAFDNILIIAIIVVALLIPLIIYGSKKPSWKPLPEECYEDGAKH